MKSIRCNTFETNSSSTHSLAISLEPLNQSIYLSQDSKYHISFRDFEGEPEHITWISEKIAFLLQLSMQGRGYYYYSDSEISPQEKEEEYEELYDLSLFKQIEMTLKLHEPKCQGLVVDDLKGHIDHQTSSDYYTGEDFLAQFNISLADYLFGNIILLADHD